MNLTWETAEKWFKIDWKEMYFWSRYKAKSIEEAWEKTLCKWILITEHGFTGMERSRAVCGLCDLFYHERKTVHCYKCPIMKYTLRLACIDTPLDFHSHYPSHELMFLLSLKEMEL